MRRAFTLIELIFVIVILGILSTIGTQIFINLFSSYRMSKIQNDLQTKTETVLNQIANRLAYRIKHSTILSSNGGPAFVSLESAATGAIGGRFALEWIAYDNDSRRGLATNWNDAVIDPSWSGLIDLQASTANTIIDPALNAVNLQASIQSLSYASIDTTVDSDANGAVIIYPNAAGSVADFGWYGGASTSLVHPVFTAGNSFLPAVANTFRGINNEVYEHYDLAFSAYAIEFNPAIAGVQDSNLMLYYNYQPWNGESYLQAAGVPSGNQALLVENVTTFKVLQIGTLIKIQLCLGLSEFEKTTLGAGSDFSICKEQAVF